MTSPLKWQRVKQPAHIFAEKMSQFIAKKNTLITDLRQELKDKDDENQKQAELIEEMEEKARQREVKLLQKFCLILNEKKLKIKQLKEEQNDSQQSSSEEEIKV